MGKHQKAWARKAYASLIDTLGRRCVFCGAVDKLTIDHINGRDYDVAKLDQSARVSRYRREASQGLVQVLCSTCNSRKGDDFPCQMSLLLEAKPVTVRHEPDPF